MTIFQRATVWIFGEEGDILTDSATQALIVASSVLVTGTMLLSPLIADLATVFGVSEATAGWLVVSFTAAAAVTLPVVGVFADYVGRKPVLITGLVLFGIGGAAVGVVSSFTAALAFRAVQGIGFAAASPIILTLFGDLYSGSRETTVQGMRVSANSVMNTAAPLLAGVLFVYSWRSPFALFLLSIPIALWVWVAVPPIETEHDLRLNAYLRGISTFLNDLAIGFLMLSFLLRFVLFYGMLTYISVLAVQEVGVAVVTVGALLSVRGVVKTLSSTQTGRLSLSFDPAVLALGGFSLIAGGTALMGLVPTMTVLFVAILAWGVGDGILSPCQKSLVNRMSPPEYRGGAMSAALTFQNIGKAIGPAVVGVLLGTIGVAPTFVVLGLVGGGIGIGSLLGLLLLYESS